MRIYLWICVYVAVLAAPLAAAPTLMPQPAQLTLTGGELQLHGTVGVQVVAATSPTDQVVADSVGAARAVAESGDAESAVAESGEAKSAIQSGLALIARTHPQLKWQPSAGQRAQLQIDIKRHISIPHLGDDERYQLEVNAQQIKLSAATSTGALYGLMTLNQLLQCSNSRCTVASLAIDDQPRYRWRGLLLDSARRFITVPDIKRTLDGMASAKLNVLHWHLTDDQAWRIESKRYPKLQQLASHGQFYSHQEVNDIVRYAAARGIRVVPEFDVPGHASAIGMAYPELLAWPDGVTRAPLAAERRFGVFNPVLDISAAASWQFIDAIVTEWRDLFPDPYLHIGGDEVKPEHWLANSAMQQWMRQRQIGDGHAIQAKFNQQLATLLQRQQRQMIGWDETLHPQLPSDTLIQSWQGQDALGAAARAGHPTLLSAGFYLDMPQPARYHWRNDPSQITTPIAQPVAAQQQFSFVLQRLNGKALSGQVRLGQDAHGAWLASIELHGRGVVAAQLQRWPVEGTTQIRLDASTFVGPLQLRFRAGQPIRDAVALIGNHSYPLQVQAQPYQALADVAPLTDPQRALLWGGEAALWTELVPADALDSKLWPRLYVVAERLWSPATGASSASLAPRLATMDAFAEQLGLLHRQQANHHLRLWATRQFPALSEPQWQALQQWVPYIQPLHYYGRHHLKTAAGRYHLDEPLNQLADALALEPPALLALQQAFDSSPACQLPAQWQTWQHAWQTQQPHLAALARQQPELQQALALAQQWQQILTSHDSPSTKTNAVIALLQPTHEWVFAPAAISLDWLDRCTQQR